MKLNLKISLKISICQYFSSLYYTCLISCSCWLPQPLPYHFQGTPWVVNLYLSSETLITWNFSYHSPIFLQLILSPLLRYASYWHGRKNKTLGFWKPKLWAWLCHNVQVSLNRSWNFPQPLFSTAKSSICSVLYYLTFTVTLRFT